jgi:hypothetical protein
VNGSVTEDFSNLVLLRGQTTLDFLMAVSGTNTFCGDNSMKHLAGGLAFAAIALAVASPASAVVLITKTPIFTPDTLTTVATFDSATLAGYKFVVTGPAASGVYGPGLIPAIAAPPLGDVSKYFAVRGGNATTNFVTFESDNATPLALTAFRFDAGSLDAYNSIFFLDKLGNTLASYTGMDLTNPVNHAGGYQFLPLANLRLTFSNFSAPVAEVVFKSTGNSFEFDNVGVTAPNIGTLGGPAPEPMTWMMLLAGFGVLGLALRSRGLGSAFAGA